jgi:hypothetical protein
MLTGPRGDPQLMHEMYHSFAPIQNPLLGQFCPNMLTASDCSLSGVVYSNFPHSTKPESSQSSTIQYSFRSHCWIKGAHAVVEWSTLSILNAVQRYLPLWPRSSALRPLPAYILFHPRPLTNGHEWQGPGPDLQNCGRGSPARVPPPAHAGRQTKRLLPLPDQQRCQAYE